MTDMIAVGLLVVRHSEPSVIQLSLTALTRQR